MLNEKVALSKRALVLSADMSRRYYGKKLVLTYSGGKDSDVMLHLAESCLEPDDFEVVNSHTSVDAPQTVRHIREQKERLATKGIEMTIHIPMDENGKQINMVSLILKNKYPPTRIQRYCCRVLKETTVSNRLCSLGVRGAESTGRRGRDTFATRGVLGGVSRLEEANFFRLTMLRKHTAVI